MNVKEIIVVEGREDSAAVKRAVNAATIETHGFGIRAETWGLIEKAYREPGIIIFTDPDFSGEEIRRKLAERFPEAKHAYLAADDASKAGDIGVENARPLIIEEALRKAKARMESPSETFTYDDMRKSGLSGNENASRKRAAAGKHLGIGYGNTGAFLKKLNKYGVTREEFDEAILVCVDRAVGGEKQLQAVEAPGSEFPD